MGSNQGKEAMKKVQPRKRYLTKEEYSEIHRLYWEEGWDQYSIAAEVLGCANQGHVSRIVNGPPPMSWEERRSLKSSCSKSYKAPKYKTPYVKMAIQSGRDGTKAKLSFKKAQDIRHTYFKGKHSQLDLAGMYGVNQSTINRIISGARWKKL